MKSFHHHGNSVLSCLVHEFISSGLLMCQKTNHYFVNHTCCTIGDCLQSVDTTVFSLHLLLKGSFLKALITSHQLFNGHHFLRSDVLLHSYSDSVVFYQTELFIFSDEAGFEPATLSCCSTSLSYSGFIRKEDSNL